VLFRHAVVRLKRRYPTITLNGVPTQKFHAQLHRRFQWNTVFRIAVSTNTASVFDDCVELYLEGRLKGSWTGDCAAVMQRETVTVMPSCSGGGNVVVA